MITAATTVSVNGVQGVFFIIAALLFLIAAIIAWFVVPRNYWATLVAAGLFFAVLTGIVH